MILLRQASGRWRRGPEDCLTGVGPQYRMGNDRRHSDLPHTRNTNRALQHSLPRLVSVIQAMISSHARMFQFQFLEVGFLRCYPCDWMEDPTRLVKTTLAGLVLVPDDVRLVDCTCRVDCPAVYSCPSLLMHA